MLKIFQAIEGGCVPKKDFILHLLLKKMFNFFEKTFKHFFTLSSESVSHGQFTFYKM